jgi:hypothetical protein
MQHKERPEVKEAQNVTEQPVQAPGVTELSDDDVDGVAGGACVTPGGPVSPLADVDTGPPSPQPSGGGFHTPPHPNPPMPRGVGIAEEVGEDAAELDF